MDDLEPYDFWNKLPGPGPFDFRNFSSIPIKTSLEQGIRTGIMEYLGVQWVVDSVAPHEITFSRTDRPLRVRIHRTFKAKDGSPCFVLWAKMYVPDAIAFDTVVGLGAFKQALAKELDMEVEHRARLVPEDEGMMADLEMSLVMRLDEFPPPSQDGSTSRWFIWAILGLQWALDSIEANPNP
jgi:hypothetical protein